MQVHGILVFCRLTCVLKVTPAEMESLEASLETWVSRCDRHVVICEGNCGKVKHYHVPFEVCYIELATL